MPIAQQDLEAILKEGFPDSEIQVDDWRPIDEWGHDAQWSDRMHHELHVLLLSLIHI